MESHPDDPRLTWQHDVQALLQPRVLPRLLLLFVLTNVAALLMGIAFFVIWQALSLGSIRLAIYWAPLYRGMARVLGVNLEPDRPQWRLAPLTGWQLPGLTLRVVITLAFISAGIWLLFRLGLCGQNIICLLARSTASPNP